MSNNMDGAQIASRRPKFAVTVRVVMPVGIPVYLGVVSGTIQYGVIFISPLQQSDYKLLWPSCLLYLRHQRLLAISVSKMALKTVLCFEIVLAGATLVGHMLHASPNIQLIKL